jgi:hypothetical protein
MAATKAAIGFGYALSSSATSGGTYAPIAEILDLKPGKKVVEKIVIQRNDSPDLFGEKIPGWKDVGDWDVKVVYDKDKRVALEAMVGVPKFWKFVRPDGTSTSAFAAFMSELGDETPLKQEMSCDFKLTVSGDAVFTLS